MPKKRSISFIKDNNKGYTLMELMVVVAIMLVMTGLAGFGVSLIIRGNTTKASNNLYQGLGMLRTDALSQSGEWYGRIYKDGSTYKYTIYHIKKNVTPNPAGGLPLITYDTEVYEEDSLGSRITIRCISQAGTEYEITESDNVWILFKPGTGKCGGVRLGPSYDSNWDNNSICSATDTTVRFDIVASGETKKKSMTLYLKTGKVIADL